MILAEIHELRFMAGAIGASYAMWENVRTARMEARGGLRRRTFLTTAVLAAIYAAQYVLRATTTVLPGWWPEMLTYLSVFVFFAVWARPARIRRKIIEANVCMTSAEVIRSIEERDQ